MLGLLRRIPLWSYLAAIALSANLLAYCGCKSPGTSAAPPAFPEGTLYCVSGTSARGAGVFCGPLRDCERVRKAAGDWGHLWGLDGPPSTCGRGTVSASD